MDFTWIFTLAALLLAYFYMRGTKKGSEQRKKRRVHLIVFGLCLLILYFITQLIRR